MLLDYLGHPAEADLIEHAVIDAIAAGEVTHDLGGTLGTRGAGEAVAGRVES